MADTAFGDDFVCEFADALHRTFQHDSFEALVVIQVRMHRGDRQLMMRVFNAG